MQSKRTRAEYLAYLNDRLAQISEPGLRSNLENAIAAAGAFDRSDSPLGTLARLVEACDAIESGDAALLAKRLQLSESTFRPGRRVLNSKTIDAYVQLRKADDARARRPSEWNGPRSETIRRDANLKGYLNARKDALVATSKPRAGSRLRRVEEIVGGISNPEDRQDLRFVLDNGIKAQRELDLLRRGIEQNFPTVVLEELLRPKKKLAEPDNKSSLSAAYRQVAAQLRRKLGDNDHLRQFGLVNDNGRLKTFSGAHFLSRDELDVLTQLLSSALR